MPYYNKFLLKVTIASLLGLVGQLALAACPDSLTINIRDKVVGTFDGETIYFCKQDFANSTLSFKPTNTDLLPGGNQVISRGSTIQTQPLSNSINLAGFNVENLAFNTLSANYPNQNGQFGSPSLFNFYTRVNRFNNCSTQYPLMRSFLRANPNTFQLNTSFDAITADSSSNTSLVKITGAKLRSAIDPTKELSATIDLYYTNPTSGQYFSSNIPSYRDCWLGVGARVTITPDDGSLKYAGDYSLKIGVNSQ